MDARRVTLPTILAGPILRRVDATSVSVFLALSKPANVTLSVWAGMQMSSGAGTIASPGATVATGTAATRRVGDKLHLIVVTAKTATGFTPGAIHSYDVVVDGSGLKAEGLLRDEVQGARLANVGADAPLHRALGYETDRLPGFVTPAPTLPGLRFAHTSCRRANFPGWDALAWLDDWMKKGIADQVGTWPQHLFLTGDQIYADDVGAALLPMLTRLGGELLGGTEKFPVSDTQSWPLDAAHFPPLRRGTILRTIARMTTTESQNHLLGFGEFAAMYLAAWSSRAWSALGTDAEIFVPIASVSSDTRSIVTNWELCDEPGKPDWKAKLTKKLADVSDLQAAKDFRDSVPQVARVLANCPTYMIWDDHEVTDDWNLSGKWVARVYSRPTGRAIIRNAAVAYGLFQGWGNDPAAFDKPGNNKDFLDQAVALFAGVGDYPAAPVNRMEEVLGFPSAAADKRAIWHYVVDGPRHRAIVLDTRSLRDTGALGSVAPPKLLGDSLEAQIPNGPLTDGRELLIMISAPPVIGPDLYDRVFQPLVTAVWDAKNVGVDAWSAIFPGNPSEAEKQRQILERELEHVTGTEKFDAEGWAGDPAAQEALFAKLATYPRVIMLGGDVHYSDTLTLDYWKNNVPVPARIVQLTSSGARNGWPGNIESQFRRNFVLQDLMTGVLVERIAWSGAAKVTLPAGAHIGAGRRARMGRSPSLLPAAGWPAGTTTSQAPDWRWRIKLIADTRIGGQNDAPPDPPLLPMEIDPNNSRPGYAAVVKRHQTFALTHRPLMRTMMFETNIGIVSFVADGPTVKLTHRLLSASLDAPTLYGVNTLHEVSLRPTDEPVPVLIAG